MNENIENLKREVVSSISISKQDRDEMLSDLRDLEEDNKKSAQMRLEEIELKYRIAKDNIVWGCIFGAAIIVYLLHKYW